MFECIACTGVFVRAVSAHVLNDSCHLRAFQRLRPISRSARTSTWYQRHYALQASPELQASPKNGLPTDRGDLAAQPSPEITKKSQRFQKEPVSPDLKKKRSLETELLYLRDPLKLADNTVALLKEDQYEKALEVVKAASNRMSCVVSWNCLVDHELSGGKVHNALKLYNQVFALYLKLYKAVLTIGR